MKLSKPISYNGKSITSTTTVDCGFIDLAEALTNTANATGDQRAHAMRVRMVAQCRMVDDKDEKHGVEYHDIPMLPARLGKAMAVALSEIEDVEVTAKLVKDGDGLDDPIVIELSSPLGAQSSKQGEIVITELEFLATSFGALERALSSENAMDQTVGILRHCASAPQAKGLPTPLPDGILRQITLSDGMSITELVTTKMLSLQ